MAVNPLSERPPKGGRMSFAEYRELERRMPHAKYEYLNGRARLMAGGSWAHDRISRNTANAIDIKFRSGPCHVCGSDMKVLIGTRSDGSEYRVYPDVTVSCNVDDRRLDNKLIRTPRIVVEVLSPSTERIDRGEKLEAYKACPGIQEYMLVSQFAPHVELYRRERGEGTPWGKCPVCRGGKSELRSVDIFIPIDDIYKKIDFNEITEDEDE